MSLELEIVNFSLVVTGEAHNPTILNPDFLARRRIVPEDWGWEVGAPPITTPPLSQVQYKSGVTVSVEPGKLQITDGGKQRNPATSRIKTIAQAYVNALPHVPYTAVGINFNCFVRSKDPTAEILERFLKPGPWAGEKRPLYAVGIRLVYQLDDARLTLGLEPSVAQRLELGRPIENASVIGATANFHRELTAHDDLNRVLSIFEGANRDWENFRELVEEFLK